MMRSSNPIQSPDGARGGQSEDGKKSEAKSNAVSFDVNAFVYKVLLCILNMFKSN